MSNLVPIKGNMPAVMAKALKGNVKEAVEDLSGGIVSGFPLISFRGKTWRVRKGGEESNYVDADGDAVQSIEVVILRANPRPSKLYYDKAYVEGDATPPKCWSADGIKPDKGVPEPQSKTCQSCPHNEWGSKITPQGTKTRACSDSRRLAVAFLHEIEEKGEDAHKLLLRVPAASLNPLKDYAEKVLAPKGALYFAVVTKIGFDVNAQFPKLTFKALRFLTDEEAEIVVKLREDEEVHRILAESIELAEAVKVKEAGDDDDEIPGTKPSKLVAVEEDDDEDDEDDDEDEAPPPPPKKAKKKAKKVAVEEDDSPASKAAKKAAAVSGGEDFDSMLKGILGDEDEDE
jgi:hypothetical protein